MQDLFINLSDIKNNLNQKESLNCCLTKKNIFSTKTADSKNYEKRFFCEKCNKLFSTHSSLRIHIMTIHENNRPFKCTFPDCTKAYISKAKLIIHERTHTRIKPFVCEICKKSFNEKGNLKTHFKLHSGIRPFKCSLCDKSYKSKGHLKDHIEIQHHKIKKFYCQFCNKNFGRMSALNVHTRVHTKEKKFKCKFESCGKRFIDKRNMENHYKSHLKNLNQKAKIFNIKKTQDPIKVEKNFEQIKIEEKQKNENKIDISLIGKKENLSQDCYDFIKYNDKSSLNSINNPNLGKFSEFNGFPLIINSIKSNFGIMNDIKEKNEGNYLENVKISNDNYFIRNYINNSNRCNNFMSINYNNLGIFIPHILYRNTFNNNFI